MPFPDFINDPYLNPDKIIAERFTASFMNNKKWIRLIDGLTEDIEEWMIVNYKLIYDDTIGQAGFWQTDYYHWFIEPIMYKEVEWMEIPTSYEDWVNRDNHKAGKKIYFQDIEPFEKKMNAIGQFRYDKDESGIRIYGYL